MCRWGRGAPSGRASLRIRPTTDRFWWVIAAGYLAIFSVLYVPDLKSAPLERAIHALLLGGPAVLLALRLRSSPRGSRLTLFAGVVALAFSLGLDVASAVPALRDIPFVESDSASCRTLQSAAFNLGFFLILVSCLRLLEHSRRDQAEARLAFRRYRELFEGMRDAVFESEVSGRFLSVNPAALDLLGYDAEEEILRVDIPTQVYVDPHDRIRMRQRVERDGFVKDFEVRLRRRDGSVIHALVNSSGNRDSDGRLTGFRGTIRDVTEHRRAREEIARLEQLNRNIIESLSHGLLVVDGQLNTLLYNRALERITGVPREEVIGRPPWDRLPSLARHGMEKRIRRAKEGETVGRDRIPLVRADGSQGHLSDVYSPLRNRDGEILGVIGFVEETTEKMQLEQQLIQAEKVAAIGQMVSGIAHEINNPLTSVSGFAQLLLASECSEEVKRDVRKIADAAERCGQVVKGLLTYGRKHEHRMALVDPVDVLEQSHELRAYQLSVQDVEVQRVYEPGLPLVLGDRFQLQQVVLNLLQNAEDALREGGTRGIIRLSAQRVGDRVLLSVFNSGPRIPDGIIRRVFDPFFTTKEVGRGTGLGLSVAQNIVRNHEGTIRVQNLRDGVQFDVDLPVSVSDAPLEPEPAPRSEQLPAAALGGVRLLVVDDEEAIQEIFVSALPEAEVVTVRDGRQALARLERETWDAVITDLKMPGGVGGLDVLAWARRHRPDLLSRIVLMTGASLDEADGRDALPSGAKVLVKPFALADLRGRIAEAVAAGAGEAAACRS